jgi:hypothetical protein
MTKGKKLSHVECPDCQHQLIEREPNNWECPYCVKDFSTRTLLKIALRASKVHGLLDHIVVKDPSNKTRTLKVGTV